jgi:hypothetical protein
MRTPRRGSDTVLRDRIDAMIKPLDDIPGKPDAEERTPLSSLPEEEDPPQRALTMRRLMSSSASWASARLLTSS